MENIIKNKIFRPRLSRSCRCIIIQRHGYESVVNCVLLSDQKYPIISYEYLSKSLIFQLHSNIENFTYIYWMCTLLFDLITNLIHDIAPHTNFQLNCQKELLPCYRNLLECRLEMLHSHLWIFLSHIKHCIPQYLIPHILSYSHIPMLMLISCWWIESFFILENPSSLF